MWSQWWKINQVFPCHKTTLTQLKPPKTQEKLKVQQGDYVRAPIASTGVDIAKGKLQY